MVKVLCIGSVNIDHFFHVPHIVKAGETLQTQKHWLEAGGKGANQSYALAQVKSNLSVSKA